MNGLMAILSSGKTRQVLIMAHMFPISTHVYQQEPSNRQQPTLSFHLLISHQLSLLITLLQLFRIHLVEPRLIYRVVEDRPVESILCWHPVWLGNTSWWRLSHDCGERCTRGVLIPFGTLWKNRHFNVFLFIYKWVMFHSCVSLLDGSLRYL